MLLDTHIVLWWISGDVSRIPPSVVEALSDPGTDLTVSAVVVGQLPLHHRDPFDRLLVAQAQLEHLAIVTVDPWVEAYEVDVVR